MELMYSKTDEQARKNIETVLALYDEMINGKNPKLAVEKYLRSDYIQHNPLIADGAESLAQFFGAVLQDRVRLSVVVYRVIAVDQQVWAHVNFKNLYSDDVSDLGIAGVDIYRFDEGGKIAEHWDVLQPVPESSKSANSNGMF